MTRAERRRRVAASPPPYPLACSDFLDFFSRQRLYLKHMHQLTNQLFTFAFWFKPHSELGWRRA
jgi:hypothetical protein